MIRAFHIIWFIVAASAAVADVLCALYFRKTRTRFGKYVAILFVCSAIEATVATFSLIIFWPDEIHAVPGFAISRTTGRTIEAVGAWLFLAYLFFWISPGEDTHQTRT